MTHFPHFEIQQKYQMKRNIPTKTKLNCVLDFANMQQSPLEYSSLFVVSLYLWTYMQIEVYFLCRLCNANSNENKKQDKNTVDTTKKFDQIQNAIHSIQAVYRV